MNILGISAFYHDSAACLVRDGQILAAAQEERFTRKKHDLSFPINAVNFCLEYGKIKSADLDIVIFYEKPFLKFERILETYLAFAPRGIKSFIKAMPLWIKQKIWMKEEIRRQLDYDGLLLFPEHHLSHAAAAFFPSPFERSAFLTMDGVGEWTTTSFGTGIDNRVEIIADIKFPHSLGLLYSAFTYYTGFKVNSGEYKVMGLAPYGEPRYKDVILSELVDVRDDGSFRMNMAYFNYCAGLTMTNEKFNRLFEGPPRKPESPLTQKDMDLARSVQAVTEEVMLKAARHVKKETGEKYLCLAGGVALNCVGNGLILRKGIFEDIWIQPASGDAGGALGAALLAWHHYKDEPRQVISKLDSQQGSFLGPSFDNDQIADALDNFGAVYETLPEEELPGKVSTLINEGKVIGWFEGRMEFGPRALGARSILGDARSPEMQEKVNLKIKFRESFRPFAPSIKAEQVSEYFELDHPSPYMLLVAPVSEGHRKQVTDEESDRQGLAKLKVTRSDIPAVTHVDYSARIQTVHRETNPLYYHLVETFGKEHGCPVIINTSFNVRGEPIVCIPEDAYRCFMRTEMDYLVIGNFILNKEFQPPWSEKDDWQSKIGLD